MAWLRYLGAAAGGVLVLGVGLALPWAAGAQEEAVPDSIIKSFAVVDISRIFRDSKYIRDIRNQINEGFSERDRKLQEMTTRRQKLYDYLEHERLALTDAEIAERSNELDILEVKIQSGNRELNDDKRLSFNARQRELEKLVLEVVAQVAAKDRRYVVLELGAVLFVEESIDMTAAVIEEIDRVHGTKGS